MRLFIYQYPLFKSQFELDVLYLGSVSFIYCEFIAVHYSKSYAACVNLNITIKFWKPNIFISEVC